jgi:hypothetical protein
LCGKTLRRSALFRLDGVSERGAVLALPPSPGIGGRHIAIRRELRIRSTGDWRHRWWSSDILGELSQVLGGGDEENLVAGTAQAPQPQPVELKDALHVGKQHATSLLDDRMWRQEQTLVGYNQKFMVVRTPQTAAFSTVPLPDGLGTPPPGCQIYWKSGCSVQPRLSWAV